MIDIKEENYIIPKGLLDLVINCLEDEGGYVDLLQKLKQLKKCTLSKAIQQYNQDVIAELEVASDTSEDYSSGRAYEYAAKLIKEGVKNGIKT